MTEIGFVFMWDTHEAAWRLQFEELKAYKEKNGHCNVPRSEGKFGRWVMEQRGLYKACKLSKERIDALKEIGFVWDAHEAAWRLQFEELKAYKEKNGHCNVPRVKGSWEYGSWNSVKSTKHAS